MPSAARIGDNASGHDGAPETSGTEASPNVFIEAIPAMRQGDAFGGMHGHASGVSGYKSETRAFYPAPNAQAWSGSQCLPAAVHTTQAVHMLSTQSCIYK